MKKNPTGIQFARARKMLSLTQMAVAKLKRTGISQTEISHIENDKSTNQSRIRKLRRFYERKGISFGPDGMHVFQGMPSCDSIETMKCESIDREKKSVRNKVALKIRLKINGMSPKIADPKNANL